MATDYGLDVDCGTDLDPMLRDVTGERLMAQAMLHRLMTRQGMLLDDPFYGFGINDLLSEETTDAELAIICRRMSSELEKDERVANADVVGVRTEEAGAFNYEFGITGHGAAGPFALTIGADDVTVEILRVGSAL